MMRISLPLSHLRWMIHGGSSVLLGAMMLTPTLALKGTRVIAQSPPLLSQEIPSSPQPAQELPSEIPTVSPPGTGYLDQPNFLVAESWRRAQLAYTFTGLNASVDSLVFSPDSQSLVAGGSSFDPRIKVWSVVTGDEVFQIRAQKSAIYALAISPNGQYLATGGADDTVQIWSWEQAERIATFLRHKDNVMSLAITPDGEVLVSGALDGIIVWSVVPQRPIYTLSPLGNPALELAIHPNGYILASGDQKGTVTLWDLQTGQRIPQTFRPHQSRISGLLFTPNGDRLITSSDEPGIKVWDLNTGELLFILQGHTGPIRQIALHPDGEILASASNDGVRLWNIRTGEFLIRYDDHKDWVQTVAFSPDGQFLATGGYDATVKLWRRNIPALVTPTDEGDFASPADDPLEEIEITPPLP